MEEISKKTKVDKGNQCHFQILKIALTLITFELFEQQLVRLWSDGHLAKNIHSRLQGVQARGCALLASKNTFPTQTSGCRQSQ